MNDIESNEQPLLDVAVIPEASGAVTVVTAYADRTLRWTDPDSVPEVDLASLRIRRPEDAPRRTHPRHEDEQADETSGIYLGPEQDCFVHARVRANV